MTEEVYNLDQEKGIEESIDALGKKWKVYRARGNGLCFTRPDPDRADARIPDNCSGLWTKAVLLQEQIDLYVKKTWEIAAKANADAERKRQVALEHKAKTKTKVKNDTGKSNK